MEVLLVINPKAGRYSILKHVDKIEKNFRKNPDVNVRIIYTKKEYNAEEIMKKYNLAKTDLVVFCGGDGTLNEGINGLIKSNYDVPVSFIPRGTMNDFARTIKMPTNKMKLSKSVGNIDDLKIDALDVGKINDRYFCYVSAFGNFTDVGYVTSQKLKNKIGRFAYYLTVLKELINIKPYKVTVKNNGVSFTDDILFGAISDSVYIAGLKWYKRKDIDLKDGTLDMVLIRKPKNIFGYFKIIKGFLKKEYTIENNYYFNKVKDLEIISEKPISWTVDGEYYGDIKEVKIKNITQRVRFAIPKDK